GSEIFLCAAASAMALMKQADQPAANSCSGLVPVPGVPGVESFTSSRPSEVREAPSRPPVVWALAVYNNFSCWAAAGFVSTWLRAASLIEREFSLAQIRFDQLGKANATAKPRQMATHYSISPSGSQSGSSLVDCYFAAVSSPSTESEERSRCLRPRWDFRFR